MTAASRGLYRRSRRAAVRLRYGSVCSGIEAASVAWDPLGWTPVFFAEIEPFPSRVLAHHWPHVPNLGNFTTIDAASVGPVDLLVGGTPCQAFSQAGHRLSLADARGNLSLAYAVLAHDLARHAGCRWAVWENVPGVLSTPDNAFGCLLGQLVGADGPLHLPRGIGRWPDAGMVAGPLARAAWRILDAQYFGLAQRRRRVFVVVGFGDGADPAKVLFERQGVRRNPPPRGKTGQRVTSAIADGAARGSGCRNDAGPAENLIAHTLRGEGFDASEDGTGRGTPIVPVAVGCLNGLGGYGAQLPTLRANGGDAAGGSEAILAFGGENCSGSIEIATTCAAHGRRQDFEAETFIVSAPVAFDCKAGGDTSFAVGEIPGTLRGAGHGGGHAAIAFATTQITSAMPSWAVRRLTPTECHRLQGFPPLRQTVIINLCFDHPKSHVGAGAKSPKSPLSVDPAPVLASRSDVSSVVQTFSMLHRDQGKLVAVDVLLLSGRPEAETSSAEKSEWSASIVSEVNSSPLLMHLEDFAAPLALMMRELQFQTPSQESAGSSIILRLGKSFAGKCGLAIEALAADAAITISEVTIPTLSITSLLGHDTPIFASISESCCFSVARAIAGFIPVAIQKCCSAAIEISIEEDHCALPGAADGSIYKALGNSMAVPVMRWIGERIAAVDGAVRQSVADYEIAPPVEPARQAETAAKVERPT